MWVRNKLWLWGVCLPLLFSTAVGQEAALVPPPPAPPTLWNFLGIPQGARKVHGALFNTRGNRPNIEKKPPLKAIGDPENLKSQNEAIKQAAKVKQEEDLKPQKIKAIKYLASIGCGCYDKDGEITNSLIAAAEDCTEEVRVTTMEELLKLACGKTCSKCGMTCCCKEPMLKKLAQIAYVKDEFGCYLEPSSRVRELAAQVLQACCPSPLPPVIQAKEPEPKRVDPNIDPIPRKIPVIPEGSDKKDDVLEEGQKSKSLDADKLDAAEEIRAKEEDFEGKTKAEELGIDSRDAGNEPVQTRLRMSDRIPTRLTGAQGLRLAPNRPAPIVNPDIQMSSVPNPEGGVVIGYDPAHSLAYVHFEDPTLAAAIGTEVYIRVNPTRGKGFCGIWKVVASDRGRANLVPVDNGDEHAILPGDHVLFGDPPVAVTPVIFIDR